MKVSLILSGIAGLALAIWLFVHYGLAQIGDAFAAAGALGLAAICAAHIVSLVLRGLGWRALLLEPHRRATLACLWARWLRDSTGNLLVLLPMAGELIGARELTMRGIRLAPAGASTVVDMTIEILSQLVFTLIGVALLVAAQPSVGNVWWSIGGLVVAAAAMAGFIAVQRNGLFQFFERMSERLGLKEHFASLGELGRIDAAIREIYSRPMRVATSIMLHFAAWIAAAGEVWVGVWFMGYDLSFADALIIESVVLALRTAAFIVPGAAGVQEGGYLMLGTMLGLPPDAALALALLKRSREFVIGLPALLIWQGIESRRLWLRSVRSRREREVSEPRA